MNSVGMQRYFISLKNCHTADALYSLRILFAINRMYFVMQTVNSIIVIPLRIIGWFLSLPLLTGCNFSPAIPVIGAYYPDWLFCLIGGVILTLITRKFILHKYSGLAFIGIIYTALFALYSMLFWLVFF